MASCMLPTCQGWRRCMSWYVIRHDVLRNKASLVIRRSPLNSQGGIPVLTVALCRGVGVFAVVLPVTHSYLRSHSQASLRRLGCCTLFCLSLILEHILAYLFTLGITS
ncbi:hypothetical protein BJ170DRAFT_327546 [Xylariales sp. AK1849]|nr:hypothetical protein BJ170DRAFT_327546 [Xylariales sp. AK1849]